MLDRILVIGGGSIGQLHYKIAKILLPNSECLHLQQREFIFLSGAKFIHGDQYTKAMAFKPNLVIVAGPATTHIRSAIPFAHLGSHLLIEKPLGVDRDYDLINSLEEICVKNGVICQIGYNLRFLQSLIEFKKLIRSRHIGKVHTFKCEVGQNINTWRASNSPSDSVSISQSLGGGVLNELSHDIDYLLWIFGKCKWVTSVLLNQCMKSIDVEDTAHLIIGFDDADVSSNVVGTVSIDFIRHDCIRECIVIGEFVSISWDGISGEVKVLMSGEKKWKIVFSQPIQSREESYIAEWKTLICAINNHDIAYPNISDGLKVVRVIDAAKKSSKTKSVVYL